MKKFVLICLLFSFSVYAQAQNNEGGNSNAMDSLFASISRHLSGYSSESVYLQTSKDIYESGEDLWFKAYQFDAQSFGLSAQSKTLYLQMVDSRDSVVWREKYPVEKGIAAGHVYVDERLSDGDYFLEAYTRGSFHNNTTEMLSARKIRVIKNIVKDSQQVGKEEQRGLRFELFPEGGNLIAGLSSQLAFKATDSNGYPVDVEGALYEDGSPVRAFSSFYDGMGKISITPLAWKRYHIRLKDGKTYPLPQIYPQGMNLRLSHQDKDGIEFVISQTEGLPEQDVYLLGQMRGMVCCIAKGKLKDSIRIKIPLTQFYYQGIVEFTLFDNAMQPVSERLVYVLPEKRLNISIEPDKNSYVLREKAKLNVKVTDSEGKPVKANLGISVFDRAYLNPAAPENILTHCYLTSQIRGKIHNPKFYFDEGNKDRMQAMDNLLLTQGWRRYARSVQDAVSPSGMFLPDEITGIQTVNNKRKEKSLKSPEQLIQVSGAEKNSDFVWVDLSGHFTIGTDMMEKLRGSYVYLKPMLPKEFSPNLEITDYFSQIDSIRKRKPSYCPTMNLSQLEKEQAYSIPIVSSDSTTLLEEVTVTRKVGSAFRDKFMGHLDSLASANLNKAWVCGCATNSIYYLNDYMGYSHHPEGCPICATVEKKSLPVKGERYWLIKYEPVGPDGVWVLTDRQTIIYRGPEFTEEELLKMNNLWRTKGYYASREFYQPDEVDMHLSIPDARNTLLWQPSIATDEKGEASVSFYCSDVNTGFVGIVEGTDGSGLLGTGKCEFRVIRKVTE